MPTSATPLIERVWTAARASRGSTTTVDIGRIDRRSLDRFGIAATGSVVDPGSLDVCDPLYLSSVLAWGAGPAESELLPDGNAADPFAGVDVSGLRLMAGGQDVVFHRDLEPDTPIVLEVTILDAQLKRGRGGTLLLLTVDRRYSDSFGLVMECRETFIGREEVA